MSGNTKGETAVTGTAYIEMLIKRHEHDGTGYVSREAGTELKAIETALAAKDSEILNARREVTGAYVLSLQHILDGVIVLDTPKLVIRIEKTIRDLMEADLSLSPPTEPEECEWVQEDPFGSGDSCIWQTDCGHEFVFDEGTPSDNGAKWCLYCGKKLVERAVEDTQ